MKLILSAISLAVLTTVAHAQQPVSLTLNLTDIQISLSGPGAAAGFESGDGPTLWGDYSSSSQFGEQLPGAGLDDTKQGSVPSWYDASHLATQVSSSQGTGSQTIDFKDGVGSLLSHVDTSYRTLGGITTMVDAQRMNAVTGGLPEGPYTGMITVPADSTLSVSLLYDARYSFDTTPLAPGWGSSAYLQADLGLRQVDLFSNAAGYNGLQTYLKSFDTAQFQPGKVLAGSDAGRWTLTFSNDTTSAEYADLYMDATLASSLYKVTAPVPEPASALLMAVGLGIVYRRRRPARV